MENEIKAIIEKNLPEQVGNLLKVRLEKAERDAIRVNELTISCEQKDKRIDELNTMLQKHGEITTRERVVHDREMKVAEAERNQKVFQAELKAAEAEKRANEIAGFTGMVFKSPIFRKTVTENTTISGQYSYNENRQIDIPSKTRTEDTAEE